MCYWFFLLIFMLKGVHSLGLVSLHAPKYAEVGDAIKLTCGYDLEGDTLYSIKWYRNDIEFYRYVPRDRPPGQFFPLIGVTVDAEKSVNGTLILRNTSSTTTGTFKCEVSADAPSFQTVSAQRKLLIQENAAFSSHSSVVMISPHLIIITLIILPLIKRYMKSIC